MLGLKRKLALNNSIQACCYDCLDMSSGGHDVTSKGKVTYDPSVTSIGQLYISRLRLCQRAVSQTQCG